MFLVGGCDALKPDKRDNLTRYEIFVEVDGKPYTITRTIQNWVTYGFDTNQGSSQGRRSDYGTFGEKIHDNQAIVISFAPSYNRRGKWKKDATEVQTSEDAEYLKVAFKILLLDHYKNPQVIEMYDSKEAFESAGARVKVLKTTRQTIPKELRWSFQADGKDKYYDYVLKYQNSASLQSKKHFEVRKYFSGPLNDEVLEQIFSEFPELRTKTGVYRLENGYKDYRLVGISGGRISTLISQANICKQDLSFNPCKSYVAKKYNDQWVFEKPALPIKVYFDNSPRWPLSFYEDEGTVLLGDKTVILKNEPELRNQYINFDTKEYYGFSWGYYNTREHKK